MIKEGRVDRRLNRACMHTNTQTGEHEKTLVSRGRGELCVDQECTCARTKPYKWKLSTDQGGHRTCMETPSRERANLKRKEMGWHQGVHRNGRGVTSRSVHRQDEGRERNFELQRPSLRGYRTQQTQETLTGGIRRRDDPRGLFGQQRRKGRQGEALRHEADSRLRIRGDRMALKAGAYCETKGAILIKKGRVASK